MQWSKYKNSVIVILLLLNCFLLLLSLEQSRRQTQAESTVQENAIEILANQGILLSSEIVPWQSSISPLVQAGALQDDQLFAETLVGAVSGEAGGITTRFHGERGIAEFFQAGNFEVSYSGIDPVHLENAEDAQNFLGSVGIQAIPTTNQPPQDGQYAFWQTVAGHPVFTCEILVTCEGTQLTHLSGRRLQTTLEEGTDQLYAAATLLVNLAQARAEGRVNCQEILNIQEGYINQGIIPVWRIQTDSGVIYLDCLTGEIRIVG